MWVMEDAPSGYLQSTEALVTFILFINFASIHTTSMVSPPKTITYLTTESLL